MLPKAEIARKLRSEYMREWRKHNPDKVRTHLKNYWERKAQALIEANRIGSEEDLSGMVEDGRKDEHIGTNHEIKGTAAEKERRA